MHEKKALWNTTFTIELYAASFFTHTRFLTSETERGDKKAQRVTFPTKKVYTHPISDFYRFVRIPFETFFDGRRLIFTTSCTDRNKAFVLRTGLCIVNVSTLSDISWKVRSRSKKEFLVMFICPSRVGIAHSKC